IEEKDLFLKLIDVKGLGPKMALPILATGSIPGIIDAINRENILYLKKFPKIGEKVAKQIILDLKGKVHTDEEYNSEIDNDDVVEALKALGYKLSDINRILPKVNKNESVENQIKEALKLFLK
ncbi:MAG TPA: helix-hairpin-helix domain-containing protein, partial [Bacilli bacterium]|nr:helix-hairpin-helix domain-containing protein [Bacilli bacterium]